MRHAVTALLSVALLAGAAQAAEPGRRYFAPSQSLPGTPQPPFSEAVEANGTLYVSGMIDLDPKTGKPPATSAEGAKLVLDAFKATLAEAGYTMDDLVQVQIFARDLADFPIFNKAYVTYFTGPKPARAVIGAGNLLAGAHFEVMGIAVHKAK
jgi:2-iminobutanoate/2-iminopropanoate deaminase